MIWSLWDRQYNLRNLSGPSKQGLQTAEVVPGNDPSTMSLETAMKTTPLKSLVAIASGGSRRSTGTQGFPLGCLTPKAIRVPRHCCASTIPAERYRLIKRCATDLGNWTNTMRFRRAVYGHLAGVLAPVNPALAL